MSIIHTFRLPVKARGWKKNPMLWTKYEQQQCSVVLICLLFKLKKKKQIERKNTYENSIRQYSHLLCASPFQIMQYPLSETPNQSFMRSTMLCRKAKEYGFHIAFDVCNSLCIDNGIRETNNKSWKRQNV